MMMSRGKVASGVWILLGLNPMGGRLSIRACFME